jgi:hypothetical protein
MVPGQLQIEAAATPPAPTLKIECPSLRPPSCARCKLNCVAGTAHQDIGTGRNIPTRRQSNGLAGQRSSKKLPLLLPCFPVQQDTPVEVLHLLGRPPIKVQAVEQAMLCDSLCPLLELASQILTRTSRPASSPSLACLAKTVRSCKIQCRDSL